MAAIEGAEKTAPMDDKGFAAFAAQIAHLTVRVGNSTIPFLPSVLTKVPRADSRLSWIKLLATDSQQFKTHCARSRSAPFV